MEKRLCAPDYLLFEELPRAERIYTDLSIRIAQNM